MSEWVTCPGCRREVDDLCECDARTAPVCESRCCELDHPVGREPWRTAT